MKIFQDLEEFKNPHQPAFLTIGMFDGVHRGHQAVLQKVHDDAKNQNGQSIVITFKNHPSTVLKPDSTVPLLNTLEHRIQLLEQQQIDVLFLLTFTKEFSEQTAEFFLKKICHSVPFSKLVLGYDAVLGKDRQGNREKIQELSKSLHFEVDYLPEYIANNLCVSSSKIRKFIQNGHLNEVEKLLGRRYSILSAVTPGIGKGKTIGFPTANIDVTGLCLPPQGVYAVKVVIDGNPFDGIANLGIAPTIRNDHFPTLEVHLFNKKEDLYGKSIEVIFFDYIRPEVKFADLKHLKGQIENDIQQAKKNLARP